MFNLWPKNEVKEIIDNMPKFAWKVGPSFYIDDKEYTIGELVDYIKNLLKQNKDLNDVLKSIEEDGTEEHNKAIKLREENVKLKIEIDRLNERVNEVDSDMNEEYRAEVFRLRNDNAIWKAKHQVIQNDYKKCTEQRDEYMHQLNAANKEIDALKTKHPMYPLHWGGVSNLMATWEEAASDLALRVAKLEEQLKHSQKIICPK